MNKRIENIEQSQSALLKKMTSQERLFEQQHSTLTSVLGLVTELNKLQRSGEQPSSRTQAGD